MNTTRAKSLSHLATYIALIVICGMAVFPFLWMISTSLKPDSQLVESPPRWMPDQFVWSNYKLALTNESTDFPLWTRNTLIIATLAVIGTTFSSAVVAYGFARIRFPGRGALFALMLSTMMVPFPVTMVPSLIFEVRPARTDIVAQPSSIGSSGVPTFWIWWKWSITQKES